MLSTAPVRRNKTSFGRNSVRCLAACGLVLGLALPRAPAAPAAPAAPLGAGAAAAALLDLTAARVLAPADLAGPSQMAVRMLLEEVQRRSRIRWQVVHSWPDGKQPVIALSLPATAAGSGRDGRAAAGADGPGKQPGPEGYRLDVERGNRVVVRVLGADPRGLLYGVGRLLRALHIRRDRIALDGDLQVAAAPQCALRGHQLGYRPKTNSYDAWTVPMWQQYIRDLVVFGNNAVELIPPRSDDAADSPHFPLKQLPMMVEMSRIADSYGLDVWIWYPAMDRDYAKPATVAAALDEWSQVYQALPRLDAVFVPGGDPGHTRPRVLMALLEKQAQRLRQYHPRAKMWMSPQSFSAQWMHEFLQYMHTAHPAWLGGLVFGPQNRISLPELRAAVDRRYPIRRYPDITHSIRCQYPVPDWDVAFPMTENREVINPRPLDQTNIFRLWDRAAVGFITYSEGCNDDVNKIIWSVLGWDREADPLETLRQYARYFIGDEFTDDFAHGLLALERNWRGPLLTHAGVERTLETFQRLERRASPQVRLNWRFQQALYRAYYDAYLRRRLLYETDLEQQAMAALRQAPRWGSRRALDRVAAILDRAVTEPVAGGLRARVFELAEALYQSIHMQLSVPRYQAIAVGRGANLDLIDVPLNNRLWLEAEIARLRRLPAEAERRQGIERILHWTDPGPGGFYDDLGNPSDQPHLVRGEGFATDPEFRRTARVGFASEPGRRISWIRHAESRYDAPLEMHYTGLDPRARYAVRVLYAGDRFDRRVRLLADRQYEVHGFTAKPRPLAPREFPLPAAATADGELRLTWTQQPGDGGSGRGCQVAEVWLVKQP